jgi:hypothetical protein
MTNQSHSDALREGLLSMESWDDAKRAEFDDAVQAMLEQRLTPVQRTSFILASIVVVALACLNLWLAITMTQSPLIARLGFAGGALLAIVAVVWLRRVLRLGVFHRRRDPVFQSGLMWVFAVLVSVMFLMMIPQLAEANLGGSLGMMGMMLVTLLGAGVQLTRTCIEQSELNTHQRMLELALRLIEQSTEHAKP